MQAEDRIRLKSGTFDREAWVALWDRLPERMRRSAAEFVLQKLHATESRGRWSFSWHYETNEEREESGAPIFEFDQAGDVITFKGSLQIGSGGKEIISDPKSLVSVACLMITDWQTLRQAIPGDSTLCDNFSEYTNHEDQRFAELVRAGKNPCRVLVPAAEFLAWCSSNSRTPNAASRDEFGAERFLQDLSQYRNKMDGE